MKFFKQKILNKIERFLKGLSNGTLFQEFHRNLSVRDKHKCYMLAIEHMFEPRVGTL